ncbi:MAG: hypothetical protein ACXVG9_13280, partial [Terriglobales bacterium]
PRRATMDLRARQSVAAEGYFLGCQLRRLGATDAEWCANVDTWCDGPRFKYRGHELRTYFARGLEAGYKDKTAPAIPALDQ